MNSPLISSSPCVLVIFVMLIAFAGYLIFNFIRVGKLYFLGSGDSRSPYILTVFLIMLLNISLIIFSFLSPQIYVVIPFMTIFSFTTILYALLKSRLVGYTTINMKNGIKQILIVVTTILYFIYFSYSTYYINNFLISTSYIIEDINKSNILTFLGSLYLRSNTNHFGPILFMFFVSFSFVIGILIFDKIEKRSNYVIRRDYLLLVIPVLIFFLKFNIANNSIYKIFVGIFVILIYAIFMYAILREISSIYYHSRKVNVKQGPVNLVINQLLVAVKEDRPFNKLEKDKLDYVVKMISTDADLEKIIYAESTVFNRKKRKLLKLIKLLSYDIIL